MSELEELQQENIELKRQFERLTRWKDLLEAAPEGAQDVIQERYLAGEMIAPIIESWRTDNENLQRTNDELMISTAGLLEEIEQLTRMVENRPSFDPHNETHAMFQRLWECTNKLVEKDAFKGVFRHLQWQEECMNAYEKRLELNGVQPPKLPPYPMGESVSQADSDKAENRHTI